MAQITRFPFTRHLRSDPSHHVLHYRRGRLVRSGRGVAYWFMPLSASVAEVPCDDRELAFLFHARTADFQDVTTQGVITYRVAAPEKVADRVDFSIDLVRGVWKQTPLEQIGHLLSQLAQQFAWDYVAHTPVRAVLAEGMDHVCEKIREGFTKHAPLAEMGLEIVAVRITGVAPSADLEKALQTPTRESIQQQADEATFQRRALAVEKERAIQENELQNKIELAKREELLIGQQGANGKRLARETADAEAIAAEAAAARQRIDGAAQAEFVRLVQTAKVEAEKGRIDIYRDLPSQVLLGLAARRFAGKVERIDHLNLGGDVLGGALTDLLEAGTKRLTTGVATSKGVS
ncbi:MAG: SPFH domain-containing protein [Planctomycetes bacterium]|nr:SPFH domain-containing protein [Planctomycetota bacterium]